jgi:hypothetical protein
LSTLGLSSPSQGKAIFLTFQTATSRWEIVSSGKNAGNAFCSNAFLFYAACSDELCWYILQIWSNELCVPQIAIFNTHILKQTISKSRVQDEGHKNKDYQLKNQLHLSKGHLNKRHSNNLYFLQKSFEQVSFVHGLFEQTSFEQH